MKLNAAREAARHVRDGMVVGLGSGTTVKIFIDVLAERVRQENLTIFFVSSSIDTSLYAAGKGLLEVPLHEYTPEVSFDGADAVLPDRSLIKGGGGCLLREKIVDYYSKEYVVIVDATKVAETPRNLNVPVEVHPQAFKKVMEELRKSYGAVNVTLRTYEKGKLGPVLTDNGNFILDALFDELKDPLRLELSLKSVPGLIETGIFSVKKPSKIIVGYLHGVQVI